MSARPRRVRRFLIVTHRWTSLVLGLVLLAVTTSGAVLVYRPEIVRMLHQDAYAAGGGPASVSIPDARETVQAAHPDFAATSVWYEHGVYRVTDYETSYTVDPGTGEELGHIGATPDWLLFLDNVHLCLLSCADYPGYVPVLEKQVPLTGWLGFEGEGVTVAGLVLGVLALLLLFLSITGLWLWFPRRGKRAGKWKSAVSVRWKRGRFARDTDLHNVIGLVALPLLLVWALTGASYEFGFVEKAWYAATPGGHLEGEDPLSAEADTPDVTEEQAIAAAAALHPDATLVNVDLPAEDDPTAAYTMYFSDGYDPWAHGEYPGDIGVFVDRHTGVATDYYGFADASVAQHLYEDFNYPVHTGYLVNGWWKSLWFLIGLAPLLLAVTGLSTWLVRRRTRKARKRAARTGAAPPAVPQDVAAELERDPEQAPDLAGRLGG